MFENINVISAWDGWMDAERKIKYNVMARQGQNKDTVVYSMYTDLLPKEVLNEDVPELQKPDEEAVQEV